MLNLKCWFECDKFILWFNYCLFMSMINLVFEVYIFGMDSCTGLCIPLPFRFGIRGFASRVYLGFDSQLHGSVEI